MRRLGDPWFSRMGLNGPVPWGNGSGGCYTQDVWNPSYVPGMLWWFDFSQIATLFQDAARTIPVTADGDPIGGVTDLSGNGRHLSQAIAAGRPLYKTGAINGLSVGRADGVDDYLVFAGNVDENNAVYFVIKKGINLGWQLYLQGQISLGRIDFFDVTITRYRDHAVVSNFSLTPASANYQFGFVRDDGNVTMYRNAASEVLANAGTGLDIRWFWDKFDGDTGEIFSYIVPPSAGDHTLIWQYLRDKWAVY